jgi:hypothetical protein
MTLRPAGLVLATASLVLALSGISVISHALHHPGQPAAPAPARSARPVTPASPATPRGSRRPPTPAERDGSGPSSSSAPVNQMVAGGGPAGDHAIQEVLEASTPRNLPPGTEQQLTALGRKVWLAEATGAGRAAWPGYFRRTDTRFTYTRVRIQAAIARATSAGRAQVILVWAGTDPGGKTEEDRPATVAFQQIEGTWQPIR